LRLRSSPTLAALLAMLGFLLVVSASSARASRRAERPRKAQLIHLITERRSQVDDLDTGVRKLRSQVAVAVREASRRTQEDRQRSELLADLGLQAGTTPVQGPGVSVKLSDSDRPPPTPADAGAYRIHDTDLRLVVNALFAAGAEALAINNSRVVATTPIRAAGSTIVVNFRPLVPPYVVDAIGADPAAFGRSQIARRFHRWSELFGLGFSVRRRDRLTVAAFTGRVAVASATPVGTGG
jgi:uncharacterized protein YlxW (UPF0749 family)